MPMVLFPSSRRARVVLTLVAFAIGMAIGRLPGPFGPIILALVIGLIVGYWAGLKSVLSA